MENKHLGHDLATRAAENARPLHASGRSIALSLETVCTVLLLLVVLAVVAQFLGNAFVLTRQSDAKMATSVTARQIAEEFQAAGSAEEFCTALAAEGFGTGDGGRIEGTVERVAEAPVDLSISLDSKPAGRGTLETAHIEAQAADNPSVAFSLETSRYVRGERP